MKAFSMILLLACFIIFAAASCEETNNKDDCGCEGTILYTIEESEPQIGKLSYKIQLDSLDVFYNDKYWIGYTESNCLNCVHVFIICNEDILSTELKSDLMTGKEIDVRFSGMVKNVCDKTYSPADYSYNRITLTKIQKQ